MEIFWSAGLLKPATGLQDLPDAKTSMCRVLGHGKGGTVGVPVVVRGMKAKEVDSEVKDFMRVERSEGIFGRQSYQESRRKTKRR